jgi:hypothetical protein
MMMVAIAKIKKKLVPHKKQQREGSFERTLQTNDTNLHGNM